jgi:hypothetical protein
MLFQLKIRKEKIQKPNNYLKDNFKSKEIIKIFIRKLNKLFSFGVLFLLKLFFIYNNFYLLQI